MTLLLKALAPLRGSGVQALNLGPGADNDVELGSPQVGEAERAVLRSSKLALGLPVSAVLTASRGPATLSMHMGTGLVHSEHHCPCSNHWHVLHTA
jgi:hypothetical protein